MASAKKRKDSKGALTTEWSACAFKLHKDRTSKKRKSDAFYGEQTEVYDGCTKAHNALAQKFKDRKRHTKSFKITSKHALEVVKKALKDIKSRTIKNIVIDSFKEVRDNFADDKKWNYEP